MIIIEEYTEAKIHQKNSHAEESAADCLNKEKCFKPALKVFSVASSLSGPQARWTESSFSCFRTVATTLWTKRYLVVTGAFYLTGPECII